MTAAANNVPTVALPLSRARVGAQAARFRLTTSVRECGGSGRAVHRSWLTKPPNGGLLKPRNTSPKCPFERQGPRLAPVSTARHPCGRGAQLEHAYAQPAPGVWRAPRCLHRRPLTTPRHRFPHILTPLADATRSRRAISAICSPLCPVYPLMTLGLQARQRPQSQFANFGYHTPAQEPPAPHPSKIASRTQGRLQL